MCVEQTWRTVGTTTLSVVDEELQEPEREQ